MKPEPTEVLRALRKIRNQEQALAFDYQLDQYFQIPSNADINTKNYSELSNEALSTSYFDFFTVLNDLDTNETLVDLGSGFCRGSLLANILDLPVECLSVEIEAERIKPAQKICNGTIINADIMTTDFELPQTTTAIFLYMPAGLMFARIIQLLLSFNREVKVYVIESHGQMIESIDYFPELFRNKCIISSTIIERHDCNIYRYQFIPTDLSTKLSTKKKDFALKLLLAGLSEEFELHIKDERGTWVAPLWQAELFPYENKAYLEIQKPKRLLCLQECALEIKSSSYFSVLYENLPKDVVKVYCRPPVFEMLDGSFRKLDGRICFLPDF